MSSMRVQNQGRNVVEIDLPNGEVVFSYERPCAVRVCSSTYPCAARRPSSTTTARHVSELVRRFGAVDVHHSALDVLLERAACRECSRHSAAETVLGTLRIPTRLNGVRGFGKRITEIMRHLEVARNALGVEVVFTFSPEYDDGQIWYQPHARAETIGHEDRNDRVALLKTVPGQEQPPIAMLLSTERGQRLSEILPYDYADGRKEAIKRTLIAICDEVERVVVGKSAE